MKIICVGDSITRAQVSADYVRLMQARLPGAELVNAGVNYDISANVPNRLGQVIAAKPDAVTILIGTNDVLFTLADKNARALRRRWQLTADLTAEQYHADLDRIVTLLRERTSARLALLSLPVIGEDLRSVPVERTMAYSDIVAKVAADSGVTYLPLNERMTAYLRQQDTPARMQYRPGRWQSASAAMQHFLLGRSFDAISRSRGLHLTSDTVHLNTRGATMIADLIDMFITGRHMPPTHMSDSRP